jgi:hypothetical protein
MKPYRAKNIHVFGNKFLREIAEAKKSKLTLYTFPYFACGSVWVRNLVSNIKGGTQTEGV